MKALSISILALAASAAFAQSDNPKLGEITTATVKAVYLKGNMPEMLRKSGPPSMNAALSINEWIDGRDYHQLREIYAHFGHHFVLRAANSPDVKMELLNANFDRISDNVKYVYLGARIEPTAWVKLRKGVSYTVVPLDNGDHYRWRVLPGVKATLH